MPLKIGDDLSELVVDFEDAISQKALSSTLIHFWSISCPSCHSNMPDLQALRDKYQVNGLQVVAVHMPRGEAELDQDKVRKVADELRVEETLLFDNEHTLTDRFGVKAVPTYFLFGPDNKLKRHAAGGFGIKMMTPALERLFPES